MMLQMNQLQNNVNWLLSHASAPVKYLTSKHLLKRPSDSNEMSVLWKDVCSCKDAMDILKVQKDDGSWCSGGSWALKPSYMQKGKPGGYDPESPKYVTTIWVLPLLGDMGFTVGDVRIKKACEYILSYTAKRMEIGYRIFNDPVFYPNPQEFEPCRFAQHLVALGKVGLQDDLRVNKGYEILINAQRNDGGWVSPHEFRTKGWTRSCPASSAFATMALYASGRPEFNSVLRNACEFLIWHLSTKDPRDIQRFFYHGHSIIHELLVFSEFRMGLKTSSIGAIVEWLMTMYYPEEGCFRYTGKPRSQFSRSKDGMDSRVARYRLYHLIEDDWLTYYATRIGFNLVNV